MSKGRRLVFVIFIALILAGYIYLSNLRVLNFDYDSIETIKINYVDKQESRIIKDKEIQKKIYDLLNTKAKFSNGEKYIDGTHISINFIFKNKKEETIYITENREKAYRFIASPISLEVYSENINNIIDL